MAYASRTYAGAGGGATTFALTNTDGNAIGYIRESDIKVTVGTTVFTNAASGTNTYQFSGTSTLEQPSGGNIVLNASTTAAVTLERTTGIQTATVTYTAGSTLTSSDLNNADNQIRFGLQEFSDIYDPFRTGTGDLAALDGIIGGSETWTSSDAFVATTSAIDTRVGTTIDTALTTDVSGGDGVTIVDNSPGAGQIRIDLDADIATLRNMQTGAATALAALTSTEIEILDGASLSTAELNFVDGVTSAIQTQLNGKQPLATDLTNLSSMQSGASTELATLTSAELDILDGLTASTTELNLLDGVPGTLTTTEIGFLDGVTSAIQTQLDGKQTTNARLTAIGALDANDSNIIVGNGTTWVAENGATARTSLGAQAAAADLTNLSSMQSGASAALALLTSAEVEILDGATPSTTELNFIDGVTSAIQGQLDGKQPLDSELTTLAGMQAGTASTLAGGTALDATIAEINSICENRAAQTTITDSDAHIPTSGAVVDHVTGAVTAVGGFIAIAGPTNFDSTQPAQGVVVSVGDVGSGFTVSSQEITITNGAGSGNNVRITGFPTSLNGTIADDVGLQVTSDKNNSTSGSPNVHRYVYHKILAKETDVIQLSDDINDFNERYRTDATGNNPTSNNHAGDLFFNQGTDTMLVRNAANNAWQEVQSSGDFYINTFASLGASGDTVPGGSATPNGTAQKFTLSNAGSVTQQHLVSVNGVVQQPSSSGSVSSAPSNGFVVDGSALVLASAPPSGATLFVVTIGASVNIGAPSNNTVGNNQLQNGAVDNAKVSANAAIDYSKLAALTDGNILVGNGSNVATSVNPSGDIDISNAGVFSIASGVIVNADVNASAAIAVSKLADFTANDANNRLLTATGTKNSYNAEANLTYDGDNLTIAVDANGEGVALTASGNHYCQVSFNSNRSANNNTLGYLPALWNNTEVASISFNAGDDTTNKDNASIRFNTASAGTNTERMQITDTGNVGIGGTPTELLHVHGTLKCNNIEILSANAFETSANVFQGTGTNGARLRSALSDQATPSFSNQADTDTGMFLPGSNVIGFTTGGVEKLRITNTGLIGMGSTNPGGALHIVSDTGDMLRLDRDNTGAVGNQVAFRHKDASNNLIETGAINCVSTANAATGELRFSTKASGGSNAEKMRIDADGDVKIIARGSGDSEAPFYVAVTGKSSSDYGGGSADTACVRIVDNGTSDSFYHGIEFRSKNGGDTRIYSHDAGSGDKADLVFSLDNSGLNERVRFLAEGGITFNGDTATENGLNDYEEGTLNWRLRKNGANDDGSNTADTKAFYTKIGNTVHIYGYIRTNSTQANEDGNLNIVDITNPDNAASLPFTPNHTGVINVGHTRTVDELEHPICIGFPADNTSVVVYTNDQVGTYSPTTNTVSTNTQTNIAITFSGVYCTNQ